MSSQTVQWTTMPSTSHYKSATIPNSYPPVIIGGDDLQGIPTAGVAMLKQSWSTVASLSSPKLGVAVVPINSEFILIVKVPKVENPFQSTRHAPLLQYKKEQLNNSIQQMLYYTRHSSMNYPVMLARITIIGIMQRQL